MDETVAPSAMLFNLVVRCIFDFVGENKRETCDPMYSSSGIALLIGPRRLHPRTFLRLEKAFFSSTVVDPFQGDQVMSRNRTLKSHPGRAPYDISEL